MTNQFKHKRYYGWHLTNMWGTPVLCAEKSYKYGYYNPNFMLMEGKVREYMKNEFGKNYIVDIAVAETEYYRKPNGYKPKYILFTLNIVFKTNITDFKDMIIDYEYVFDEIDKILNKYEKEE